MESAASKELQDIFSVLPQKAKVEAIDYVIAVDLNMPVLTIFPGRIADHLNR